MLKCPRCGGALFRDREEGGLVCLLCCRRFEYDQRPHCAPTAAGATRRSTGVTTRRSTVASGAVSTRRAAGSLPGGVSNGSNGKAGRCRYRRRVNVAGKSSRRSEPRVAVYCSSRCRTRACRRRRLAGAAA